MKNLKNNPISNRIIFLVGIVLLFGACKSNRTNDFGDTGEFADAEFIEYNNPPAEGFNVAESDPIAIVLADQVMNAMGGRATWDTTHVFYWNFLGARTLLWDKANHRVRVDIPSDTTTITLNMTDSTGQVWKAGEAFSNPDSVSKYLERARRMWINDSYWLFMPFKLKDSGVTLKYAREDTLMDGSKADVLRLTFQNVGVTPQNAYDVWVDLEDRLVKQWAYYQEASQEAPNFELPWTDYKEYDGLLLSGERGERDITDIKVMDQVPEGAFEDPAPLRF